MEREHSELIAGRIKVLLGPDWEVGELGYNEPFFFVSPSVVEGKPERDPLTILWEAQEAPGVLAGTATVMTAGDVSGKPAPDNKPLEPLLAAILEQWRSRKDGKRRGLFGR